MGVKQVEDTKLSEEEREARNKYMRRYRKTEKGKRAVARANKRYWEKKAKEMKEDNQN